MNAEPTMGFTAGRAMVAAIAVLCAAAALAVLATAAPVDRGWPRGERPSSLDTGPLGR
ncbi:hypothetical protein [Methylopila turkensis]|uniref:Uncharacterized protein n=1 Tax=Methylopila turkensis TaxID=1437816 RepID=A0A9W6N7P2_9HYPH|nr:hypothetical protein [Methylopila turkensis]GLK80576.1 hypothetical protein GCM10008174_23170 [Methylopila turkensis]